MLDLVPLALRARDPARDNALVVVPEGPLAEPDAIALLQRRQGVEASLGRFALDHAGLGRLRAAAGARARRATVLRLPGGVLLERDVTLPLAAEREPQRVLHYEMDRLTPFASDEVFWSWSLLRRDRARGRLHLRLSLVPKVSVQALIALLGAAGLAPTLLEAGVNGSARSIALVRPDAAGAVWRRRAMQVSIGACATLAATAILLPFLLQSLALAAVDQRIAALKPAVDQADALRARMSGAAGTDVVAAERAHLGDALRVLAAVTDILPDDTYLTDLTMNDGKLGIAGQSAAASRLIPALAADPSLRNPSFVAPVTRIQSGSADQFSIRADLAP